MYLVACLQRLLFCDLLWRCWKDVVQGSLLSLGSSRLKSCSCLRASMITYLRCTATPSAETVPSLAIVFVISPHDRSGIQVETSPSVDPRRGGSHPGSPDGVTRSVAPARLRRQNQRHALTKNQPGEERYFCKENLSQR